MASESRFQSIDNVLHSSACTSDACRIHPSPSKTPGIPTTSPMLHSPLLPPIFIFRRCNKLDRMCILPFLQPFSLWRPGSRQMFRFRSSGNPSHSLGQHWTWQTVVEHKLLGFQSSTNLIAYCEWHLRFHRRFHFDNIILRIMIPPL